MSKKWYDLDSLNWVNFKNNIKDVVTVDDTFKTTFNILINYLKSENFEYKKIQLPKIENTNKDNFLRTGLHQLIRFAQLYNHLSIYKQANVVYPSKKKITRFSDNDKRINAWVIYANSSDPKNMDVQDNLLQFGTGIGKDDFGKKGAILNILVTHQCVLDLIEKFGERIKHGQVGANNENISGFTWHGIPSKNLFHIYGANNARGGVWSKNSGDNIGGDGQANSMVDQVPGVFGICSMEMNEKQSKLKKVDEYKNIFENQMKNPKKKETKGKKTAAKKKKKTDKKKKKKTKENKESGGNPKEAFSFLKEKFKLDNLDNYEKEAKSILNFIDKDEDVNTIKESIIDLYKKSPLNKYSQDIKNLTGGYKTKYYSSESDYNSEYSYTSDDSKYSYYDSDNSTKSFGSLYSSVYGSDEDESGIIDSDKECEIYYDSSDESDEYYDSSDDDQIGGNKLEPGDYIDLLIKKDMNYTVEFF